MSVCVYVCVCACVRGARSNEGFSHPADLDEFTVQCASSKRYFENCLGRADFVKRSEIIELVRFLPIYFE